MEHIFYDVVGVGAGPFNLSVAALLHPLKDIRNRSFDRQQQYSWHPGMLLSNTTGQNSFFKDLVSFAYPTKPFSFLAFLHPKTRLSQYVNYGFWITTSETTCVPRNLVVGTGHSPAIPATAEGIFGVGMVALFWKKHSARSLLPKPASSSCL